MPRSLRFVLVALLLLAIPVAWWALSATSGPSSPPGLAPAPAGTSAASTARAPAGAPQRPQGDSVQPEEELPSEEEEQEEEKATGPCIAIEVTAHGAPVASAHVTAAQRDDEHSYAEVDPVDVGPDGRGLGFCEPGTYLLAAHAPGFAPAILEIVEPQAGSPPLARFQLQPGNAVSGHVLDKDSQEPVAGAQLVFTPLEDFAVQDSDVVLDEVSLTSDAKGAFRTADLAAGTYRISVEAPGHTSKSLDVRAPRAEHLSIELEGTSRLEGQVVDSEGAPVPGAEIWVSNHGNVDTDKAPRSDAQGHFSVEVEAGVYHVAARAGGQVGMHEGQVTVTRGGLVDGLLIRLRPSGSLSVKVFMHSSLKPVDNAFVSVRSVGSGWSRVQQTDASGTVHLEHLLPGEYSLTLNQADLPPITRDGLQVQEGQELSVELPVTPFASLEGRMTDALGRPALDGPVKAESLEDPTNEKKQHWTTADAEGGYHLTGLEPGRYRIEARCGPETPAIVRELALEEGETAHADFAFPEALGEVQGVTQRPDGSPPRYQVMVSASAGEDSDTSQEFADEAGLFTLRLMPGTYSLTAVYSDAEEPGPEQRVTVEAGKVARVRLTVPDSVTETRGVILNSRGEPEPSATVTISSDELYASEEADPQGRFTLRTPARSAGTTVHLHVESESEEGDARNVRVGSSNVVVRLVKAAALRGRVVATRGPPIQGFELYVFRQGDSSSQEPVGGARPFAGDTFELVDLPTGPFQLLVRTSDGRGGKALVRLEPGQTGNAEIAVGGLGRVIGRLIRTPGVPRAGWVHLDFDTPQQRDAYANKDGRFELFAIEPGPHVLLPGAPETRSLTLREGETLDVGDVGLEAPPKPAP